MHYLGFQGVPRRYFSLGTTDFLPESAHALNTSITISAIILAAAQLLFFINIFISLRNGKKAKPNCWGATSLEWLTPDTPPKHGNWGPNFHVLEAYQESTIQVMLHPSNLVLLFFRFVDL